MGRPILDAAVRLDLDDAADAPRPAIVTNETDAAERPRRVEAGAGQERPIEDAQTVAPPGKTDLTSSGMSGPRSAKAAGMRMSLKRPPIADVS
jgi:hypothetical protein